MPASIQCKECGYMHPPVAAGQCPRAKQKAVDEEAKAEADTRVANLSVEIQRTYLQKIRKIEDVERKIELGRNILRYINGL